MGLQDVEHIAHRNRNASAERCADQQLTPVQRSDHLAQEHAANPCSKPARGARRFGDVCAVPMSP